MHGEITSTVVFFGAASIAAGVGWAGHLGHKGARQIFIGLLLGIVVAFCFACVVIAIIFAGCAMSSRNSW